MKTIDVNFKEWYDKANGNSYCAGTVTIDYGTPEEKTLACPFGYGYGDFYMQAAKEALEDAGVIPEQSGGYLWRYCEENGVELRHNLETNCSRRSLMSIS